MYVYVCACVCVCTFACVHIFACLWPYQQQPSTMVITAARMITKSPTDEAITIELSVKELMTYMYTFKKLNALSVN